MADETTAQRRPKKIGRVQIGFNVLAQIILLLFLVAMVNSIAFKHYQRALDLNPRHRGAHEYAGEAYLIVNNLAKAEEHLAALEKICLIPCEEYEDLRKAIAEYRRRAAK